MASLGSMLNSVLTTGTPTQFLKDPTNPIPIFRVGGNTPKPAAPKPTYLAPNRLPGGDTTTGGGGYDPAAAAAAAAASAARDTFNTGKQSIYDSVNDSTATQGIRYNSGVLDLLAGLRTGQRSVDTMGAKNELARNQGVAGVMGMVGRGIASGGVALANRNAGDSSGAEGIANAYGTLGRQQMSSIGNQYEMGNKDIALQQQSLDEQMASGVRKMGEDKQIYINEIVANAGNEFAQLNAAAAGASLPDRIAIDQEKEAIRQKVITALQSYDQKLNSGVAAINPTTIDQRRAEANKLRDAGTNLGADMFNFTSEAPLQMGGVAPAGGGLPIYTMPRGRKLA